MYPQRPVKWYKMVTKQACCLW